MLVLMGRVPWPFDDGWKTRSGNLLLELRRRGASVHTLAFGESKRSLLDLQSIFGEFEAIERGRTYRLDRLLRGLVGRTPFSILNYGSNEFAQRVRQLTAEMTFDILLVEDIVMAQFALHARIPKWVLDMHNIESHLLDRFAAIERSLGKRWYARLTARKLARYELEITKRFSRILVCSNDDKTRLEELGVTCRVEIVPNGVDISYFQREESVSRNNSIVFVGSMDYHANVSAMKFFVEKVFPLIRRDLPKAELLIVGKNPTTEVLNMVGDGIVVTGSVPDVRPFMNSASVVIAPLLVGGGTRLKILEAMSMSCAIVSTRIGCEGLDVRSGHDIEIADSPQEFASKVLTLLRTPALAERQGENARQTVTLKYAWPAVTGSFDTTFR